MITPSATIHKNNNNTIEIGKNKTKTKNNYSKSPIVKSTPSKKTNKTSIITNQAKNIIENQNLFKIKNYLVKSGISMS